MTADPGRGVNFQPSPGGQFSGVVDTCRLFLPFLVAQGLDLGGEAPLFLAEGLISDLALDVEVEELRPPGLQLRDRFGTVSDLAIVRRRSEPS